MTLAGSTHMKKLDQTEMHDSHWRRASSVSRSNVDLRDSDGRRDGQERLAATDEWKAGR